MYRILVILSGIPCSGKSTLTHNLISKYSNDFRIFKIERDDVFSRISNMYPDVGNNKRNKLISNAMNEIYTQFNECDVSSILFVDSCSGGDGVKEFIMSKAHARTHTIVINIKPKLLDSEGAGAAILDMDFYISRASRRPPHQVFPKELGAQIKELTKCYSQWNLTEPSSLWTVYTLDWLWTMDDIHDFTIGLN